MRYDWWCIQEGLCTWNIQVKVRLWWAIFQTPKSYKIKGEWIQIQSKFKNLWFDIQAKIILVVVALPSTSTQYRIQPERFQFPWFLDFLASSQKWDGCREAIRGLLNVWALWGTFWIGWPWCEGPWDGSSMTGGCVRDASMREPHRHTSCALTALPTSLALWCCMFSTPGTRVRGQLGSLLSSFTTRTNRFKVERKCPPIVCL